MATTSRFHLEKFGGAEGGAITDNGGKFSTVDRDTLDLLLYAFERHDHSADPTATALADPSDAPTGSMATTGGTLPGASNYYYVVSYLDEFGLETAASDELALATAAAPIVTDAPIVNGDSTAGNTLPNGTYYYALTALSSQGESSLGPQAIITTQPGQTGVLLTLPAMNNGITGYNVWRHGISDAGWTKVGVNATGSSWLDAGVPTGDCLTDPATQPPNSVTFSVTGTNAATITVPDPALVATVGGPVKAWRLYRSDSSGNFAPDSLVAEIVPADDVTPLDTSYTDTGSSLLVGQPPTFSSTLTPSHRLWGAGDALPATTGLPENYLFLHRAEGALYGLINNAWTKLGGGGSVVTDDSYAAVSFLTADTLPLTPNEWNSPSVANDAGHMLGAGVDVRPVPNGLGANIYNQSGTAVSALRIYTDGLYSIITTLTVAGLVAGDIVEIQLYVPDGSPDIVRQQWVVPPGQTSVDGRCAGTFRTTNVADNAYGGKDVTVAVRPWTAQTNVTLTWFSQRAVMDIGSPAAIGNKLPTAPQNGTATANADGSITFTWDAPTSPGPDGANTPIFDYWIYESDCNNITMVAPSTATSVIFPAGYHSMAAGQSYNFHIQARNFWGRGPTFDFPAVTPLTPAPDGKSVSTAFPMADGSGQIVVDNSDHDWADGYQFGVWAKFTATTTSPVTIDSVGTGTDTYLEVFAPTDPTATPDDSMLAAQGVGPVTFTPTVGQTYLVLLGTYSTSVASTTATINWSGLNQ